MSVRVPKYRLHKPTGQALVQIRGKRFYLGKHGTPNSQEKYRRLIAEHFTQQSGALPDTTKPGPKLSLNELMLAYHRFALTYYVKEGAPTDELHGIRAALKRVKGIFGLTPADQFGPKAFKLVRQGMIDEGLSRKYVNDSMARIRRMFRWAVSEELVAPNVYQALATIPGLRRGRSEARETAPILPVNDDDFERTLRHLPRVVADMARFQRLTGCRPQEVCSIKPGEIRREGEVWEYRPGRHKSQHHERSRVIFIGPRAQSVLRPYLPRGSMEPCFSPIESEQQRRGSSCSSGAKASRLRDSYDRHSYRRAVNRACDKAGVSRWNPNQLRHSVATEVRRHFGLEAAQIVLGHANADVTQVYAERDQSRAIKIMREVG